jgi:hypothetical protein
LFLGDCIDRTGSLKKIAARVLNRVNAAKAHPVWVRLLGY